jgi:ABC-2 type transport system permease protein
MTALAYYISLSLRLHARNRMALMYNYLFPTFFLAAFATLYRHDRVPLAAHIGELLTVTILGGACFGLPTTLVSERERGVWRRYRLLPVPMAVPVLGSLASRFVLLLVAVALQLGLAFAIGFPGPNHWVDLGLAVAVVCVTFIGLGLVIAAVADTVPAVQALGQCVFLPMLIVGGVAVPLASLPAWAQQISLFLPGRYAVDTIQSSVTGRGIDDALFSVAALLVIGAAAGVAGVGLFRWAPGEYGARKGARYWTGAAAALAAWLGVGVVAVWSNARGESSPPPTAAPADLRRAPRIEPSPAERALTAATGAPRAESPVREPAPATREGSPAVARPARPSAPVSVPEIDAAIAFDRLPPDGGVVTPIGPGLEAVDPALVDALAPIYAGLSQWPPATVADREQRVRNLLYLPAVIDLLQLPIEPYVPLVIFNRLQVEIGREELIQVLYRIAIDPYGGEHDALGDLDAFGLSRIGDVQAVRDRAAVYAVKLLGRLIGRLG